jgi:hypothetical protein
MNKSLRNALVAVSAAALLVTGASRGLAAPADSEVWRPAPPGMAGTLFQYDSQRLPPQYDPVLLALGRSVYADLQRARQAALDREATNLRVAIQEARETLRRLQRPPEAGLLEMQLQIIRNDLKDRSKELDNELWVPVESEIDAALVYVPEEVKAQAHEAIHQARTAAAKGERERVKEQLDVVTATLQYSLGVFPLYRVMDDLDAAQSSASLSGPDWSGALEAVQSALATFHWFARVPARGLLSAYNDVINAYVLATGPAIRDDQQWKILQYLDRAEHALGDMPDGKELAGKARDLIDRGEPQGSDIKSLLNDIQSRIRSEQQQAEVRYWESIGRVAPE